VTNIARSGTPVPHPREHPHRFDAIVIAHVAIPESGPPAVGIEFLAYDDTLTAHVRCPDCPSELAKVAMPPPGCTAALLIVRHQPGCPLVSGATGSGGVL
jgi:hypothetical protein